MSVRRTRQPRGDTGPAGSTPGFSGAQIPFDDQNVPDSVDTALIATAVATYDTDSYFNLGGNPTRLTIPTTGYYHIGARINVSPAADQTFIRTLIRVNGADFTNSLFDQALTSDVAAVDRRNICSDEHFTSGDYIELMVFHTQTVATDMECNGSMWIHRVGV